MQLLFEMEKEKKSTLGFNPKGMDISLNVKQSERGTLPKGRP